MEELPASHEARSRSSNPSSFELASCPLLCAEPNLLTGQREPGYEGLMMRGMVTHSMHNRDGIQSPNSG